MSGRAEVHVSRFQLGEVQFVVASCDIRARLDRYGLTPSEEAICRLVLQGRSNGEIAEQRGTSKRTVANQLQSVYIKIGVRGRRELAATLGGG